MEESARNLEYYSVLKDCIPRQSGEPVVAYDDSGSKIVGRAGTNTCDLKASVQATAPQEYSRDDIILRLSHVA
jgi:hypothetical protein